MKKKQRGVFKLLAAGFILFTVLLICIYFLSFKLLIFGSDLSSFNPYALINEPDSSGAAYLLRTGAWLEGLDENRRVVEVQGTKQDRITAYTERDLYRLLNIYASHRPYLGFMQEAKPGETVAYWLVKIPSEVYHVHLTHISSPIQLSGGNYFLMAFIALSLSSGILISYTLSRRINKERRLREESERRKNRLLTDLSHDIKTPVSTIKAYANALKAGLVEEGKQKSYLETIDAKADRVGFLVNDLLLLLSMDDPRFRLHRETTDIAELLRGLCAEIHDRAEANGLRLDVTIPDHIVSAEIDRSLMTRVLENLLDNAVKYNLTGQTIRVNLQPKAPGLRITITDDGDEVPADQRETIFDAFVRTDKTRPSSGGTGLGLAISKGIVERHGGTIAYSREGFWNTFRIWIP